MHDAQVNELEAIPGWKWHEDECEPEPTGKVSKQIASENRHIHTCCIQPYLLHLLYLISRFGSHKRLGLAWSELILLDRSHSRSITVQLAQCPEPRNLKPTTWN